MPRTRSLALVVTLLVPATTLAGVPSSGPSPGPSSGPSSGPAPGPADPADPAAGLPTVPPPPGSEAERSELELLTKLDLGKQWRSYQAERKGENFYQFVEKNLRRRRDIGRYTTMAGVGGLFAGGAFLSVAVLREEGPTPMTVAGYAIVGVSGVATLVGAVVWGVFYRRMERLEVAEGRYYTLGPRGRFRLRAAGPGLQLTF